MSAATADLEPEDAPGAAVPPARVRMAPLVERPARVARPPGPALVPPPVAGSDAIRRRPAMGIDADNAPREQVRLPDPTKLCCAMVQAAVEALRGNRPIAQLARWVSPEIYDQLVVRSAVTQRVLGRGEPTYHAAIRRIRLCRLGENTAEATVVVDDGPRVRAVAVRLEGHRGQWRATALEIG